LLRRLAAVLANMVDVTFWEGKSSKVEMKMDNVKHWGKDCELYIALGMEPPQESSASQIKEYRVGDKCPQCNQGRLGYDGLLNLACEKCGYALQGCFT